MNNAEDCPPGAGVPIANTNDTARFPAPCATAANTSGGIVCTSSTNATVGFNPCNADSSAGNGQQLPSFHGDHTRRSVCDE